MPQRRLQHIWKRLIRIFNQSSQPQQFCRTTSKFSLQQCQMLKPSNHRLQLLTAQILILTQIPIQTLRQIRTQIRTMQAQLTKPLTQTKIQIQTQQIPLAIYLNSRPPLPLYQQSSEPSQVLSSFLSSVPLFSTSATTVTNAAKTSLSSNKRNPHPQATKTTKTTKMISPEKVINLSRTLIKINSIKTQINTSPHYPMPQSKVKKTGSVRKFIFDLIHFTWFNYLIQLSFFIA